MYNRCVNKSLLLCLLFLAPLAHAAESASPPPPIDQVTVEATRTNLTKLGQEVLQAEMRFYTRYNELNTVRDYAIECVNEAPTGSRFKRTSCQPVFKTKAEEAEAREFLRRLGSSFNTAGSINTGPAATAIAAGKPGFQKNVAEVTRKSPELIKLLEEHAALVKRYQEMARRLNGD